MSMYYGILLTAIQPNTVPEIKKVGALIEWLAKNNEIVATTDANPLIVEFLPENEESEKFASLDDKFEAKLLSNKSWQILLKALKSGNTELNGPIISAFKLTSEDLSAYITDDDSEEILESSLDDIILYSVNVKEYFSFGDWDTSIPESSFAITFNSDMKAGYPIEDAEDYFALVWARLEKSGILDEFEKILDIKLRVQRYFS